MSKKQVRPLFKQALSAVKKQVDLNNNNTKKSQYKSNLIVDSQFQDMSSGQQQRLKQLGVNINKTKPITKQLKPIIKQSQHLKQWKHDKYPQYKESYNKTSSYKLPQFNPYHNTYIIKFPTKQQYKKIYQLVKAQKAFIQQINQNYIKFSKEFAFNTCKRILKTNNIQFQDQSSIKTGDTQNSNQDKQTIFNRLK